MMEVRELLIRKLNLRCRLAPDACQAIENAALSQREYAAGTYLVREGGPPASQCSLLLSGIAIRHKVTSNGGRQIVGIELPGDFLDLQHLFLEVADHNVEALTSIRVANVERNVLKALTLDYPQIGEALWVEALIEASIAREWLTSLGRRDARARVAHLICEMAVRMAALNLDQPDTLTLPWTQEQLGDVAGLTAVHVNRMLKTLDAEGLIAQSGRQIRILDRAGLRAAADFNPRYLHLAEANTPN